MILVLASGVVPAVAACTAATEDGAVQESEQRSDAGDGGDAARDASDGGDASARGIIVDPRDGKTYPTITIGAKTWLAKNLDFAIAGSSWCYGDDPRNCATDGRLYTFESARTACPAGWHLGTDADWKALETALGMSASQLDLEGYSTVRGGSEGTTLKDPNGFGIKPAGYRGNGQYDARGDRTYIWTASMRGGDVWRRRIAVATPTIFRFTNPPQGFAISVRCAKD